MASRDDHVTGGQHNNATHQTPHLHQRRVDPNSRAGEIMPASVEEVINLGYSPALVISVHQQLLSGACDDHSGDSQNAVQSTSRNGSNTHTPGTSLSRDVSASTLLAAVDEAIHGSSDGAFESNQQFAFRLSSARAVLSSAEETSGMDTSVGLTTGETEDQRETFQDAGAVANMSSALEPSPAVVHSIPHAGTIANMSSALEVSPAVVHSIPDAGTIANMLSALEPSPAVVHSIPHTGTIANMSSALEVSPAVVHSIPHAGNTSVDSIPSSASGSATDNSAFLHPSTMSPESPTVSHKNISDAEKARERRFLLEKLQALREENRRLRARKSCLHCRQRPVALTLLPCGHFTLCEECGSSFSACPVCHQTILADVKTYLS